MEDKVTLCLAQHEAADELLARDPLALLIGMVLDQQIPLERAFKAPLDLRERFGHDLDAEELASYNPDKLAEIFAQPPALHRFPASMAKRVQELCQVLVDEYGGSAENVWAGVDRGTSLLAHVRALPGFGEQKAKIFVALLGKQLNVRPNGWEKASSPFSDRSTRMSVADIVDSTSLLEVRAYKKSLKAKAKAHPS